MSLINEQLIKAEGSIFTDVVYANHASAAFNLRLYTTLKRITADVHQAVGNNLVALILGGGYGRGEGGVVRKQGKECPANELEFTLIVERKAAVNFSILNHIREEYAEQLNIKLNFRPLLTLADIRNFPRWLKWQDLLKGHIVTYGAKNILTGNAPASLREPLPAIEATRLLLNRGAGLLWAMRVVRGVEVAPDEYFLRRSYYKCVQALGDALLITHRRYTTNYTGRDELLRRLRLENKNVADLNINELYTEALRFEFSPDNVSILPITEAELNHLASLWRECFLYVESERTGRTFNSADDYVNWNGLREFDRHKLQMLPRNLIFNLQTRRVSVRCPREELFRALPVLLEIAYQPVTAWNEKSERFLNSWRKFI